MPDANETAQPTPAPILAPPRVRFGWLFPMLRVLLVVVAGFLAWYVAGHWNRWTGAARYESTDDAYTAGDVTPLSAKVSGYVATVGVTDYQTVHKGDLIVEIDASDYRAQLMQAEANLAAAAADARQPREPEGRPARACPSGRGDYPGHAGGPAALLAGGEATARAAADAGSPAPSKRSSRRMPTRRRTTAQLALNKAQLDQQKALLASLDVQENQLRGAGQCGRGAGDAGTQQHRLHPDRLAGGRSGRPAPGPCRASSSMSGHR